MRKDILAVSAVLLSAMPANALERWTCTFPGLISPMIVRESMDVRESDVIRDGETKYRIVENNARAVAATYVRTDPPDAPMAVGTLVIEKGTGDFAISIMVPGSPISTKVVTGKCQKEN